MAVACLRRPRRRITAQKHLAVPAAAGVGRDQFGPFGGREAHTQLLVRRCTLAVEVVDGGMGGEGSWMVDGRGGRGCEGGGGEPGEWLDEANKKQSGE